jgi:hypothetical protein
LKRGSYRRFRLGNALIAALASGAGLLTLMSLASDKTSSFSQVGQLLLQVVAITLAMAVLIGIYNLFTVHVGRLLHRRPGWLYSIFTILGGLAVFGVYLGDKLKLWTGELKDQELSPTVFNAVQVSIESALASLIAFFLVYALYRLFSKRFTWSSLLFAGAVAIALLGWLPLKETDTFVDARDWLMRVPVMAGARGLVIGIGLGTVIVGVRVLAGYDQAYREP